MTTLPPERVAEQIRELATHIVGKRAIFADQVPPDLLAMVYMPLFLGALSDYSREDLEKITIVAVDGAHKTTSRFINGYPMFVECEIWLRTDAIKAWELANRMIEVQ